MAWVTILAIIIGPIAALSIQRWLDSQREKRNRKLWVFRELMVTRGSRLSQRHVDALNSIDVDFFGDRDVLEAWKKYFDLFVMANPKPSSEAELKVWIDKGDDLLAALLYKMAEVLDYHFDEVALKRNFYVPIAHGEAEVEANVIRKGFFEVFTGKRKFPIDLHIPDEVLDTLKKAGQDQPKAPPQVTVEQPKLPPRNA